MMVFGSWNWVMKVLQHKHESVNVSETKPLEKNEINFLMNIHHFPGSMKENAWINWLSKQSF